MQCCSTAQFTRVAAPQQGRHRSLQAHVLPSSSCSRLARSSSNSAHAAPLQAPQVCSRLSRRASVTCKAADDRPPASSSTSGAAAKFNPVYLVIAGAYAGLLVFKNPYIYAVLTILTILPQNSNVTSLNNLVLLFYESGLFQNFAEAVNCVRLVTWLSMGFMVASFALFK